ncbi:DNA mismatch repair protein MutL [Flavobacterium columnare NBRC 100251 = ATCC 23463]|uniref:DNA mismatch repair protein MutL n=1 Tax=Flavobacterium columnare (strain ATCC 49512 / CIP 103533 / TG 44/87) TaxID=1041826 RepID=G8X9Q7_FLACA|nr:DNA mismatch repair endonuclease MutL [Flavobacterium columnare]AEW87255.1 DNA mismatch repair protein MutL [Flavobacterium columnare ATCC 49512]OOB82495.1 DNA mismatch repair protein MutL [Flavobacterium columnare]PDS24359.1 DNA mismatch repair protein MutL [Flavobacterium columnare NBRC 100251 = ATCC 23463]GEM58806.1 DNA mismatch repair protein MutL [Flavobacterium columnare NBRC 100251 = ATCC 23463]
MSSIIQLLPDHVANQIAAGEVVQRPASVVKELVENAIDAGSTDIKLICKDAGKTLIQVIDNGKGMSVTDARLCFERHATSKIRKAEDLFDLHTKGFRGEALASIAAIAHVELKTKQDQEELGTHLIIEGSKFVSQEPSVLPKGTSFAIKNLFFNIPARRNFLKSDTVELRHIIDDFQRVALAHENIHFTFYHNGSEVFNLPQSNLRQRIVNIFAGKTNEKLVPVTEDTEIVRLKGFIGKPEFAKKNRGEQFFFVNDRFIKSGYLHHAIMAAYEGLLKEGMQPSYFLYLDVPPHTIDINIHPTKTEIKFDDEQALYAIIRSAVKHSLGQFNVAPILDFDRDANLDTPYSYVGKDAEMPTIQVDATFNPFAEEAPAPKKESTGLGSFSSGSSLNYQPKKESQSWESLYVGLKDAFEPEEIHFESESVTGSLFNDTEIEKAKSITYQLQKKYIISPIKSGMLIVDQQRAHQRILYEQLLKNITVQQANSQQLLFPLTLYFSGIEMALFLELKASLENAGFIFESAASGSVVISGIPVTMLESEVARVLEQLIADLQEEIPDSSFSQMDSMAKSMARSLAVKTGTFLTELEQENIVNNLFACKEQSVSPFNRPTFITLSVEDIDKKFSI